MVVVVSGPLVVVVDSGLDVDVVASELETLVLDGIVDAELVVGSSVVSVAPEPHASDKTTQIMRGRRSSNLLVLGVGKFTDVSHVGKPHPRVLLLPPNLHPFGGW